MTLRMIRRLQRGQMSPLVALAGAGVVVAWLALATTGPSRAPVGGLPPAVPLSVQLPMPGAIALTNGSTYTFIPTSAHQPGQNGANWRTDVEVHNPGLIAASYTFALVKRNTDNTSPVTQSFTLGPGLAVRYTDIIDSVFHFTGAAALRLSVGAGAVLVTSRTYNLIGTNPYSLPVGASFGQFVPGFADDQAIGSQQEGRIIQLSHRDPNSMEGFRTNIGILNATAGTIDTVIELYDANSVHYGTVQGADTHLRPFEYKQIDRIFERVTSGIVLDGYAIVRTTTSGGAFFAYASVIDNHRSGDSIFIPAFRLPRGSSQPTATPTRTATGAPPKTRTPTATAPTGTIDLAVYKPSNWPGCVVCNYRGNCCPPSTELLSTVYGTTVMFALGNSGTTTLTGPVQLMIRLDDVDTWTATWTPTTGLAPNAGIALTIEDLPIATTGQHVVTVVANHDHAIPEPDYSDNACGFTGTWTSIVFAPGQAIPGAPSAGRELVVRELEELQPRPVPADLTHRTLVLPWGASNLGGQRAALATAGDILVVPTSAHQPGQNGANWRSDAEAHNPGTTAAGFTIALLKRSTDNTSPATKSFTLAAGRSVRLVDLLDTEFHFTGAAALRLTVTSGTVLFTSRTYNQIGTNPWSLPAGASFGQFVPAFPVDQAIGDGQEGRIIQLSHRDPNSMGGFRTNIGYVNVTGGSIELVVDLYLASGVHLGTVSGADTQLRAWEYKQIDRIFERVTGGGVEDGYAIVRSRTAGARFFTYGSVIDNHRSGDSVYIPAFRLTRGGSVPTPTPTPTRTPTGATRTPTRTPTGPTPTATRTPTGPTPTMTATPTATAPIVVSPGAMMSDVTSSLGRIGTTSPSLDSLVSTALTTGVPALIDLAVAGNPVSRSRIPNGVRWTFGNGYTDAKGTHTGTVDLTYSNVQVSGNTINAQFTAGSTSYTKNGVKRPYDHATGTINAQQGSNGKTTATIALDGGGTIVTAEGESIPLPLTGSVQFDTARCTKYPIGGTINTDYSALLEQPASSTTGSMTFNASCDGTFQFTGPAYALAFPPEIAPSSGPCSLGLFGGMWGDIIVVKWTGAAFQATGNRTQTDDHGIVNVYQTTMQGTVSADGTTVVTFHAESHWKATYPAGYSSCPAGGCTRERWVNFTTSSLTYAGRTYFFDVYSGKGPAAFTSWSDHVVKAGWPTPSDNSDCTYPLDPSNPNNGGVTLLLVRP